MTKKYAAYAIYDKQSVRVTDNSTGEVIMQPIKLIWADGMVGVMPVFKTKKQALRFYNGSILTLDFKEVDNG